MFSLSSYKPLRDFLDENTQIYATKALLEEQAIGYESHMYYSEAVGDFTFQVYFYDEMITMIDKLKPGDYVLLKNMRGKFNKKNDKFQLSLPGHGQKWGRGCFKLDSADTDVSSFDNAKAANKIK